jgi:hypothetical protein
MIINVSISRFRQNLADYIAKVSAGHTVILENGKKEQQIIQITGRKKFNSDTFGKALMEASGIFTAENHPEWQTKEDVVNWVEKGRLSADRHF